MKIIKSLLMALINKPINTIMPFSLMQRLLIIIKALKNEFA